MKKANLTRSLMAACSIVALSAVMYGCVHSGGDDAPPPVDQPDPVDVDTKKINDAIDAATAAIDALTAMSSDADVTAAQGAIDAAQAALDATTVLSVTDVRALQTTINTAKASLSTKQTAIGNYRTHQSQLSAANTAVDAATAAVGGLSAASTDADVAAADAAVQAAKNAVAAGTMLTASETAALNGAITLAEANLTNKKSQIADRKDQDRQDQQRMTVSGAISGASAAVDGLTAMSSDADVAAAQSAINSAQAALDATTVLPASDVFALQAQINAATASLGTKQTAINNYRTHQGQLSAANSAVDAAEMAVAGLSVNSTDAEVAAAEAAVAAAKQAVMDGTMLTADEMASLNGDISAAETSLGTVKMAISDRKTHEAQYAAAMSAVGAAEMAVGDLTDESTDAEITAAENAVAMAEAAVAEGTMLTAIQRATLNGRIALTKVNLANAKTDIDDQRKYDQQLTATTSAVGAAEMAVSGLTAMSSDAEVNAAQAAIATARATLALATELPASDILALQTRINTAETSLGTKRTEIADYRTHGMQYSAAMSAVGAAERAVAGLNEMSTDENVAAAEKAIADAKSAVAAGTMLTAEEMSALNGKITMAETNLGNSKMAINDYRTHVSQLSAANSAVDAATMAVGGLTAMSDDDDVTDAKNKIAAAEAAVTAGTMLTAAEKAALTGKIAIAKVDLGNTEISIANYRTHMNQHTAAMEAVKAAEMAVAGLSADSSDEDVADADEKIAMAKQAVMNGTMLTDAEKTVLNGKITMAETSLGTAKSQIALRKERDRAQTVARLHGEASGATSDAEAAGMAADQALKDAMKYSGMLGVLDVGGDSGMATKNAQMVLDARTAASDAARDAMAAKTRAQTAKTEATGLPEDTMGRTALIAALDAAIKTADDKYKAAMAIRDGDDLKAEVQKVEGTDEMKPTKAAAKGKAVADLINTALTTDAQTPAVVADFTSVQTVIDDTDDTTGKVMMGPSDAQGMTFEMIVGAANLMDKRIVAGAPDGSASRMVKAKSVDGMKVTNLYATDPTDAPDTADGTEIETGIEYKGIGGVLFCAGTDCKVEDVEDGTFDAATSKLTGSWYFTPTGGSMTTYLAGADEDAGTYSVEDPDATDGTGYVRYGYWLSTSGTGESLVVNINRYADGPSAQTAAEVYAYTPGTDGLEDTSATYSGDALGMSIVKTTDTKGKELSRTSGGFMADVELTMKFGSTAMLGGMIDNFRGSAVDTEWEVMLKETEISDGAVDFSAADDDPKGTANWTATAWGGNGTDERPTGVYGIFDAEFTNGNVAGVYNTRKK